MMINFILFKLFIFVKYEKNIVYFNKVLLLVIHFIIVK